MAPGRRRRSGGGERVWVVVRQQDLDRPEVQLLLQWWGGPRLELP